MGIMEQQGLSRRSFMKGGIAAAGTALALGGLMGCAASGKSEDLADTGTPVAELPEPDETKQADIVVVGSGPAGMSAALEAAEQGCSVVLLESQSIAGGNFDGTEGLMGINSFMTKQQGVTVEPMEIVNKEIRQFSYMVDPLMWKDLALASGDNIQWLVDHGVELEPEVVDYTNSGGPLIYHMWKLGSSPAATMTTAAEKAGVEILTSTPAEHLVKEGDKIVGVLARKEDDSILRIDCKAVILATGGYVDNPEMMKKAIHIDDRYTRSFEGHNGDAVRMASAIGARDTTPERTLMGYICCRGLDVHRGWYTTIMVVGGTGKAIWVNQDAERFTNEGCVAITPGLQLPACLTQKKSYTIFDQNHIDSFPDAGLSTSAIEEVLEAGKDAGVKTLQEGFTFLFDEGIKSGMTTLWRADTWEELAEMSGLDKDKLLKTINDYNDYCRAQNDDDFQKDKSMLVELATPPFYMCENGFYITTTLGGLDYNRDMEVLTDEGESIPGLYVAGVDGAKLYKIFYTIDTSGSCNANNIYTGRKAAQSAVKYIG